MTYFQIRINRILRKTNRMDRTNRILVNNNRIVRMVINMFGSG
jgi:hypothetical protein